MTGQRRKQAQMGEHSRMNRTEFMRQLESLLQNISATEREEALQYYNEYFNDEKLDSINYEFVFGKEIDESNKLSK